METSDPIIQQAACLFLQSIALERESKAVKGWLESTEIEEDHLKEPEVLLEILGENPFEEHEEVKNLWKTCVAEANNDNGTSRSDEEAKSDVYDDDTVANAYSRLISDDSKTWDRTKKRLLVDLIQHGHHYRFDPKKPVGSQAIRIVQKRFQEVHDDPRQIESAYYDELFRACIRCHKRFMPEIFLTQKPKVGRIFPYRFLYLFRKAVVREVLTHESLRQICFIFVSNDFSSNLEFVNKIAKEKNFEIPDVSKILGECSPFELEYESSNFVDCLKEEIHNRICEAPRIVTIEQHYHMGCIIDAVEKKDGSSVEIRISSVLDLHDVLMELLSEDEIVSVNKLKKPNIHFWEPWVSRYWGDRYPFSTFCLSYLRNLPYSRVISPRIDMSLLGYSCQYNKDDKAKMFLSKLDEWRVENDGFWSFEKRDEDDLPFNEEFAECWKMWE